MKNKDFHLGLKQTQKDPWVEKIKTYKIGDIVEGKVTRIVKFGLFVQIQEDMEGLGSYIRIKR